MLYASASLLFCQPCRRRWLPEVLVWTGKLKAQQPWTLSTGMCVLTKGLSRRLTPVFLSISVACVRACVYVRLRACRVAKTRSQLRLYRSGMRQTKSPPFCLSVAVTRCTSACAQCVTECEGKKCGLLKGHKQLFLFLEIIYDKNCCHNQPQHTSYRLYITTNYIVQPVTSSVRWINF